MNPLWDSLVYSGFTINFGPGFYLREAGCGSSGWLSGDGYGDGENPALRENPIVNHVLNRDYKINELLR